MQRFRRLVAAIALAATATTTVAACGGGDSGDSSDAKALKLWHYESENSAMGVAWNQAIEIFKTEHPGVEVRVRAQGVRADPAERRA